MSYSFLSKTVPKDITEMAAVKNVVTALSKMVVII